MVSGREPRRVDPSGPELDPLDAVRLEIGLHGRRGAVRAAGRVVEPAQVTPRERDDGTDVVVQAVGREVGVVRAHERVAHAAAVLDRRVAERGRRGDVNQVGAEPVERRERPPPHREGDADLRVERQRDGRDVDEAFTARVLSVTRPDEEDLMPAGREVCDQPREGRDHPVRLRWDRL
jgi:hypothetical protein